MGNWSDSLSISLWIVHEFPRKQGALSQVNPLERNAGKGKFIHGPTPSSPPITTTRSPKDTYVARRLPSTPSAVTRNNYKITQDTYGARRLPSTPSAVIHLSVYYCKFVSNLFPLPITIILLKKLYLSLICSIRSFITILWSTPFTS